MLHTRSLTAAELAQALSLGGAEDPAQAIAMFRSHPDLFLALWDEDAMIGVCYGWPVLHEREMVPMMRLDLIAVVADLRGRGHGRRLLTEWERRVGQQGSWVIDVGSAADGFFLRCGYTPVEYCLKVRRELWAASGTDGRYQVSHVTGEGAIVALYVNIVGEYDAEVKARLARAFGASEGITIFRKVIAGAQPGAHSTSPL